MMQSVGQDPYDPDALWCFEFGALDLFRIWYLEFVSKFGFRASNSSDNQAIEQFDNSAI